MSSKLRTVSNCFVRTKITAVIFLIYLLVALFVVPYEGQKLAYSSFYQSSPALDRERNLQDNSKRIHKAENTLRLLKRNSKHYLNLSTPSTTQPEFCFVVVSVSRPVAMYYLTQVVASLLPQVAESDSVFTVFNAEGPTHREAVNLSNVVPVVTRVKEKTTLSKFVQEKQDYMHALEWCRATNAKFSVILQDDALPPSDFLHRLRFVVRHRAPWDETKWAFLKLYYPEKWEGWGKEPRIILELIATAIFCGVMMTTLTYVFQLVISRSLPSTCEAFSTVGILLRFLLSFALALYMLLTLGRPHWLALRNLSPHLSSVVDAPGCCIPAVVYPQGHLSDIIRHLGASSSSAGMPVDLQLDKFAKEKGLRGLLVVPNLVKHIGFVSSLGKGWKNPREFRI